MQLFILRLCMRIKRDFLSLFGFRPNNVVTVYRTETLSLNATEMVENYSQGTYLEVLDPRSDLLLGHYFNQRDVFKLKDIILEPKTGAFYSNTGRLISESTTWLNSEFYNSWPWNARTFVTKLEINDAISLPTNTYGHWLLEDLAPFLYLIERFPNSPVLLSKFSSKFVFDLMKFLNKEVVICNGPVKINSLIMVTKLKDGGWVHPKDYQLLTKFKENIVGMNYKSEHLIYTSRLNLKRCPKNELQIQKLFSEFNFTVITPHDLNFIEQLRLFSSAKIIAGVHSSASLNCIWMPKGSKIFDIINENYWTEYLHRAAAIAGVDYTWYLHDKIPDSKEEMLHLRNLIIEYVTNQSSK